MALSRESLLSFIDDKLGVDATNVGEETPLFSSGLIDSAGMVDLIVFVESEENITLAPDEISLDYLDSIGRILNFVADRQAP